MSTANAPVRRRTNRGELPTTFLPLGNPPARIAYASAWLGLVPGLGVVFGWPALVFGFLGKRHAKQDAEQRGRGHSFVSIVAGVVEIISNGAGWYLLALANDWL